MKEIIDLALIFFFFLLIVFIVCFILQVFLKIFGRKKQANKSIEKELKNHSSTQENDNHNDSGTSANDAEANWMNAVMTTTFITASMKSAQEHSEGNNHDSNSVNHDDTDSLN
ncbi:hypothetical protein ABWK33_19390 [Bacillus wiedmannii]|uniref:hypothetical protein n=1 Tax=Bacillus TaxID=1386 RepID=UPI000BF5CE5A|nr:hypothetical protein [Bacillus cereus]MDA1601108.1 hypothetical protein [Bacillus cereus]PFR50890.1 hypothetical protein COK35_08890 [Bacillus cereus]HDR7658725.1 hypothetical protein [Bacillus wiedmannii]